MYLCVRSIDIASVCDFFLLDFGTVPTVWYFLFIIFILLFTCGCKKAEITNIPATKTRKNVVTEQNWASAASLSIPTITIIITNEYSVDKMAA